MKEVTVDRGKKVFVFDDLFDHEWRSKAYVFATKSKYTIGWQDSPAIEKAQHKYLHCAMSQEDVENFDIFTQLQRLGNPDIDRMVAGKAVSRTVINLSVPTDAYFAHNHRGTSLLYYINPTWEEGWAGETLFYNESLTEIAHASMYKPGRLVIFDGSIPHALRPQSGAAPGYRFTFACFMDEGVDLSDRLKGK